MKNRLLIQAMQNILHSIEEGVHIVDAHGRSLFYNEAMADIEGLVSDEVLGKHLLEIFPNWEPSNSTLLTALSTGRTIDQQKQSYLNLKGKRISTVNTTFPIFQGDKIIGAVEIAKNFTDVNHLSEQIMDLHQKLIPNPKMQESKPRKYTFDMLIGRHPLYVNAIRIARKAAETDSSVLIEGETGTGKELFAQSIHNECSRKDKPFIAINCAAMPDTLLESILFGTAKGSFTGAVDRPGLFEQAHGGTLFLDEINSMSLPLQAKILRVLQENYVRRVGGLKDLMIDVRIIAASNEPLHEMMKSGQFRKDLYYRLNVINIRIPALRERKEDIPLLTEFFIRHFNQKLGKDVWMMSLELQEAFKNFNWVGNIRELQNVIESAINMVSDEHVVGKEHLPAHVELLQSRMLQHHVSTPPKEAFEGDLNSYLERVERSLLEEQLEKTSFNISQTAKRLGVSRQNLQYKMKRLGLTE